LYIYLYKTILNSFIETDDIEIGFGDKIPLWLFGFLYWAYHGSDALASLFVGGVIILYISKRVKIKFQIGFIFTTKFNRKDIQLVSKIISTLLAHTLSVLTYTKVLFTEIIYRCRNQRLRPTQHWINVLNINFIITPPTNNLNFWESEKWWDVDKKICRTSLS
jgi:hypothetical protein